MGARLLAIAAAVVAGAAGLSSQAAQPPIDELMAKVGAYAAGYGERPSLIVAVEKYTQRSGAARPLHLVAEFAIVRVPGGWVGFRDVVEVDGEKVTDRGDRLFKILSDPAGDSRLAQTISDESARYNIGPISRNFNVPTTTLLLFQPANLGRFSFKLAGTERVNALTVSRVDFIEVAKPSVVMTRAGRDVPMTGTLWVNRADGTVVRTKMELKGFADLVEGAQTIRSSASFDVSYRRHPEFSIWLPASMNEYYEGPLKLPFKPPFSARTLTSATYADFKRFETGATIKIQ